MNPLDFHPQIRQYAAMTSRVGSKGFWIAITALVMLSLYWGSMSLLGLKQRRDKAAVRAYVAKVQPLLTSDPRFKDVRLMGYSCDNVMCPYMPIFGMVTSQEDWNALDTLIQTSHPPVSIWVKSVRVRQENHKIP